MQIWRRQIDFQHRLLIDFHSHVEWHNSYFSFLTMDENIYFNIWVLTILVLFLKKTHSGKWVCLVVCLVDMLVRVVRCHPLYRCYGLPKKKNMVKKKRKNTIYRALNRRNSKMLWIKETFKHLSSTPHSCISL